MGGRLESLRLLLQDPTSNLTAAALGLAMLVLFVIIVVLAALAFALPAGVRPTKETREAARRKRRSRRRSRKVSRIAIAIAAIAMIASFAAAYVATSSSVYCTSTCHAMVPIGSEWESSTHKQVPCVRCHEGRYGFSAPLAVIARVRSAVYELAEAEGGAAVVSSDLCLQCHSDITRKTITGSQGLLMSHREVIAAGQQCSDCHGDQGHTPTALAAGMSACIRCHDSVTASAECVTCHPEGADSAVKYSRQSFGSPVVLKERPDCGGCHSQKSCDACHGLRMPHPEDFGDPKNHASLAAFTRKDELCYRCHVEFDCSPCHQPFAAHVPDWLEQHPLGGRENARWCNNCHRTPDMCGLCHP